MDPHEHVDIVRNEWTAGIQVRLAEVVCDQGTLRLEAASPEWEDLLSRPLADPSGGAPVVPADDPERGIWAIIATYTGDMVFATDMHSSEKCPFGRGAIIRMGPGPVAAQSAAGAPLSRGR
jgi:hypothetical protein